MLAEQGTASPIYPGRQRSLRPGASTLARKNELVECGRDAGGPTGRTLLSIVFRTIALGGEEAVRGGAARWGGLWV